MKAVRMAKQELRATQDRMIAMANVIRRVLLSAQNLNIQIQASAS